MLPYRRQFSRRDFAMNLRRCCQQLLFSENANTIYIHYKHEIHLLHKINFIVCLYTFFYYEHLNILQHFISQWLLNNCRINVLPTTFSNRCFERMILIKKNPFKKVSSFFSRMTNSLVVQRLDLSSNPGFNLYNSLNFSEV